MARRSHIRRTLAIVVREPIQHDGAEQTMGRRFAEGWAAFISRRSADDNSFDGDACKAAGFAAAKAAWEAHGRAVKLVEATDAGC